MSAKFFTIKEHEDLLAENATLKEKLMDAYTPTEEQAKRFYEYMNSAYVNGEQLSFVELWALMISFKE